MGFLDKLKAGLGKTKQALVGQIDTVLKAFVKIDEDALETGVKVFVQFVLDHMDGIDGMVYPEGSDING